MNKIIKCPKCDSDAQAFGSVSCCCDKDFCNGQRCGANELSKEYLCLDPECASAGTPPETTAYLQRHCS